MVVGSRSSSRPYMLHSNHSIDNDDDVDDDNRRGDEHNEHHNDDMTTTTNTTLALHLDGGPPMSIYYAVRQWYQVQGW